MAIKNQITVVVVLLILLQTVNSFSTPHVRRILPAGLDKCTLPDSDSFRIRPSGITTSHHRRYDFTTKDLSPSSSSSSLQVMTTGRISGRSRVATKSRDATSTSLDRSLQATYIMLASLTSSITQSIRKYWWCFPMVLAMVPPYCAIVKGTYASMPDWWSVVNMDHIAASDNANWIIAPFLGSNIAYLMSGLYLMNRFRFFQRSKSGGLEFRPTRFSMLGVWVSVAGLISTIFHSVQALGSYGLAKNLCFLDHAVAGSAILYFFDTCGLPSKMASLIGALAMVTLVISTPGYAWFHSSWHYLSAATATRWALDGHIRLSRSLPSGNW